jgi:hypothetical protein
MPLLCLLCLLTHCTVMLHCCSSSFRFEYLVATGESQTWCLKQVFKVSNNLFNKHHRGFRAWRQAREERRQAYALRQQGQQAQQAEALAQVRAQLAQQADSRAQKQQLIQAAGTGFGQRTQSNSTAGSRSSAGGKAPRQKPGTAGAGGQG